MGFSLLTGSGVYGATLSGTVSNTKGNWVELSASTPFDSHEMIVVFPSMTGTMRALVDIGTGAATSESVLVSDLFTGNGNDASGCAANVYRINVDVAAGTRLSARVQGNGTVSTNVAIYLIEGDLMGFAAPVTYGAITASTNGTEIDPGGSLDTKPGTYTTIIASTTADHARFAIAVNLAANTTPKYNHWRVDIATGAAAAETIIIPDLLFHTADLSDTILPGVYMIDVDVPSGTRLSARAQADTIDAGDRTFRMIMVGMDVVVTAAGGGAMSYPFAG